MAETGTPIAVIAASLRRERERLGLSQSELAKRAGIAKSTLSQLEAAAGNPSVETIWALSVALGVPFSRLVEAPRQVVRVIRAGEGPVVHAERATYTATLLASSVQSNKVSRRERLFGCNATSSDMCCLARRGPNVWTPSATRGHAPCSWARCSMALENH